MAGKNVYESNVSSIRILRYRTQAVADGEDPDDGPFLFLLVWGENVCGTTSFSSLFAAWAEVQAIDNQRLSDIRTAIEKDDLARVATLFSEGASPIESSAELGFILRTNGIDESARADYDFMSCMEQALLAADNHGAVAEDAIAESQQHTKGATRVSKKPWDKKF